MNSSDILRAREALAVVLRDLGPSVVDDPVRLRGALVDVLGDGARPLRPLIEALSEAASAGVPQTLRQRPDASPNDLTVRLVERGTDRDLAATAVDCWHGVIAGPVDDDAVWDATGDTEVPVPVPLPPPGPAPAPPPDFDMGSTVAPPPLPPPGWPPRRWVAAATR